MAGKFFKRADLTAERLDWGTLAWVTTKEDGSDGLTVIEVVLEPGGGHNFHRHPDQEEVITVIEGQIEQWLEHDVTTLGPGEAVFIQKGVVHASFHSGEGNAKLHVVLSPSGYGIEDVYDQEPWSGLR